MFPPAEAPFPSSSLSSRISLFCIIAIAFVYEASNIWFGTEDFDRFHTELLGIVRGQQAQACLRDLSRDVVFTVIERDRHTEVLMDIARPAPPAAETKLHFKADTDLGLPASLLQTLREFNKWW